MASLLITGGAGFIGSNFVHYWLREHPQDTLLVLDALSYAGNLANLATLQHDDRLNVVQGDIRDQPLVESLLREHEIDILVHFAAETHVDRSILDPERFFAVNVQGTQSLLNAVQRVWLQSRTASGQQRFHHVSTDEVYGSLAPNAPGFTEASSYAPNSPYARSKAESDQRVRRFFRDHGLQATISNCSNNYGPFQFPEKLMPLVISHGLRGQSIPVYGDGLQVRDWLHVLDHCRAVDAVIRSGHMGETYNIGGQAELSNLALISRLCEMLDARFANDAQLASQYPQCPAASGTSCLTLIEHVADRPGHDRRYAMDCRKLRTELGVQPAYRIEQGLQETVDWYLDNEAWWQPLLGRRQPVDWSAYGSQ